MAKREIKEKRSSFELETRGDSPLVRELAKAAAVFLDYNPRRLKKFLNLFRLQAYLCWELGLLLPIPKKVPGKDVLRLLPTVSLTQLAKLVGLSIKHPLFFEDLCKKPDLLKKINWSNALDAENTTIPKDPNLVGFLAVRPVGVDADEAEFSRIDFASFLSMIPLPSEESDLIEN